MKNSSALSLLPLVAPLPTDGADPLPVELSPFAPLVDPELEPIAVADKAVESASMEEPDPAGPGVATLPLWCARPDNIELVILVKDNDNDKL